jgi:hypothetical protein
MTDPTPLPRFKVAVLSLGNFIEFFILLLVLLSNSIISTVIVPFIPFLIADFGFDEREVSKHAGLLLSRYAFQPYCYF